MTYRKKIHLLYGPDITWCRRTDESSVALAFALYFLPSIDDPDDSDMIAETLKAELCHSCLFQASPWRECQTA